MINNPKPRPSLLFTLTVLMLLGAGSAPTSVRANPVGGNAGVHASSRSRVQVPAGTHLVVRMVDSVSSKNNRVGDTFTASLEHPLEVNGTVVAPRGTRVYGTLEEVRSAGHFKGRSQLRLALTRIEINGATLPIVTGNYDVHGKSRGKKTFKRVGIGSALGGIIGAIAGGGKGAAIGAGLGAGVGTTAQILTHGEEIKVPSETVLDFTLAQPVVLPVVG